MAKSINVESEKTNQIAMDRRASENRRLQDVPKGTERRKVQRRRQIDPTTCERDYSQDEIDFMQALDEYKRRNGRMFPTCSEILEVIREMGYVRLTAADDAADSEIDATDSEINADEVVSM